MLVLKDQEFRMLVGYIREHFGINLEKKRNLIEGRLGNHVAEAGFASYQAYFDHVFADQSGSELSNLANRLTTNHTYFLREPEHFHFMRETILPELTQRVNDRDLRIWSAGCSSGEEPYTLTMLLHDFFGYDYHKWDTTLLATDISEKALKIATAGTYPTESLENVPPDWRRRYFKPIDDKKSQVIDQVKDNVLFRKFNLMQPQFPFRRKFHVIFCRNVMIYFDKPTKEALIQRYFDVTEPGGYLMIGHAETINKNTTGYQYVRPAIYRKPL